MEPKMTAAAAARFLGVTVQAVHKKLKKRDLLFGKRENRVFFGHDTARQLFEIPFALNHRVIALQIVKGGPGKSTITKSIAVCANLHGAKILVIDLDQQGNLTRDFMPKRNDTPVMIDIVNGDASIEDAIVTIGPGLDLLPSRLDNSVLDNVIMLKSLPLDRVYRELIDTVKDRYDLVLIDCPPALSQSTAAAALAADLVIAPVAPEPYCLDGLKMTTNELKSLEKRYKQKVPLKVVLNKYNHSKALSREIFQELVKHDYFSQRLFKTVIRDSQEFPNAASEYRSIFCILKETIAKEDIEALTREVLEITNFRTADPDLFIPLGSLEENQPLQASL